MGVNPSSRQGTLAALGDVIAIRIRTRPSTQDNPGTAWFASASLAWRGGS